MIGIFKSFSEIPSSEPAAEAAQNPAEIQGTKEYFAALSNEALADQALDALAALAQRDPKVTEEILAKANAALRAEGADVREAA